MASRKRIRCQAPLSARYLKGVRVREDEGDERAGWMSAWAVPRDPANLLDLHSRRYHYLGGKSTATHKDVGVQLHTHT